MSKITLQFLTVEGGGEMFLPSIERVKAGVQRSKTRAKELEREAEEREATAKTPPKGWGQGEIDGAIEEARVRRETAKTIVLEAERMLALNEQIRKKYSDRITEYSYDFRPYTDGERQDALAAATDYSTGEPKTDLSAFRQALVFASTGIPAEHLRGFSVARADAVIREVIDRSEPDPARLDFLL